MKKIYKETIKLLKPTYFAERQEEMYTFQNKKTKEWVITYKGSKTQKKLNYLLPTTCVSKYLKVNGAIKGEFVNTEGTKEGFSLDTDQVKTNRCNKRTCSFCNKELVRKNTNKILSVFEQAIDNENSIQMITKTIPNLYISPKAWSKIMMVQRYFKKNIKRDKSKTSKIYQRKFVAEIIKKEYTVNYANPESRAYNIHYQNVIITNQDLSSADIKFINDHWNRAIKLVFPKTKISAKNKPVRVEQGGISQKVYSKYRAAKGKTAKKKARDKVVERARKMSREIAKYIGKDDTQLTITGILLGLEKSRRRAVKKGDAYKVKHYAAQIVAIKKDRPAAFRKHLESIYSFKGKMMIQFIGAYKPKEMVISSVSEVVEAYGDSAVGDFVPNGYMVLHGFNKEVLRTIGALSMSSDEKPLMQRKLEEAIEYVGDNGEVILSDSIDLAEIITTEMVLATMKYVSGNKFVVPEELPLPLEEYFEMNIFNAESISKFVSSDVVEKREQLKQIFSEDQWPELYVMDVSEQFIL